jgi:hypothetical protein
MRDVIRLASQSHHYLVIYDKHTREPLYCGPQTLCHPRTTHRAARQRPPLHWGEAVFEQLQRLLWLLRAARVRSGFGCVKWARIIARPDIA